MGHDITARPVEPMIAYLRRHMGSDTVHILYEALQSNDMDAGVSGNGDVRKFSDGQIEKAFYHLLTHPRAADLEVEIEFLSKIHNYMSRKGDNSVYVEFF